MSPLSGCLSFFRRLKTSVRRPQHVLLDDEKTAAPSGIGPEQSLIITGLGSEWPPNLYGPEALDEYISRHYDTQRPEISKLLEINKKTGIETRACFAPFDNPLWERDVPPTIEELDAVYRKHGTQLALGACRKAIREWGGSADTITHVIAVTCTNAGSPGFDLEVNIQLGLPVDVDRMLLHGVGCAGGLSALRAATQLATAATHRGKPARILVYACEICTIQISVEMEEAKRSGKPGIGPAIFADGAGAFVLCNSLAPEARDRGIYEFVDNRVLRVRDTDSHMSYLTTPLGFKLHLTKDVPELATSSVERPLTELITTFPTGPSAPPLTPASFDWALHPGGLSILTGLERALDLDAAQLRAAHAIYRSRGNTSSAAVLTVLDRLRAMGRGRDPVLACSFGPGLTVEMATLRRCRRGGAAAAETSEEDEDEDKGVAV